LQVRTGERVVRSLRKTSSVLEDVESGLVLREAMRFGVFTVENVAPSCVLYSLVKMVHEFSFEELN
jgi:hypothetical protein